MLLLWAFSVFWLFTTRTWRHFIPTSTGLWGVLRFYAYGIFKGERHPYRKAYWRKHNPLQALAYLVLKIVLFPAIWISGLAYLSYFAWRESAQCSGLGARGHPAFVVHTAIPSAPCVRDPDLHELHPRLHAHHRPFLPRPCDADDDRFR